MDEKHDNKGNGGVLRLSQKPPQNISQETRQDDPEKTEPSPSPDQITEGEPTDTTVYPSGMKLALIMVSIYVALFLVALDRLIISTAIPQITNDFQSAGDIGWYGTAYMLTLCSFQLVFGKIYQNFSVKTVFLCAILLFEVGSALCGAAPSSVAFIIGRALAGLGAGGIFAGTVSLSLPYSNLFATPADLTSSLSSLFILCRCTTAPSSKACLVPCLASRPLQGRSLAAPSRIMPHGCGASISTYPLVV